jgi:hypothetical protein
LWCGVGPVSESQQVTIGALPDNVLIEIFDFYQVFVEDWEKLVHVCQRWRYLIFDSPIRLNLRLFCTEKSPVKNLLDVWPPFPLFIHANYHLDLSEPADDLDSDREDSFLDNVVAALERCDRVRHIDIFTPDFLLEEIVTAMQGPFPALIFLSLQSAEVSVFPFPDTFLNGSAPCLRHLALDGISYPSLRQLLSTTSDLTSLCLYSIPNSASGYIPPETMVTCLSALPKLETFVIRFEFRTRRQPPRRNLPQTRFVLSALTVLDFDGVSEYLEDLVARIDAPLLDEFRINFSHQPVFDIPQTIRFFSPIDSFRPSSLTLVFSLYFNALISFSSRHSTCPYPHHSACPYSWQIDCQQLEQQVTSVAQICSQILPFRSSVKSLNIELTGILDFLTEEEIPDPTLWSQLFHSFTSVQSLEIPAILEPSIAAALQGLTGESSGEPFPSLCNLSIVGTMSDEPVQQGTQSFIAARQQNGCPIAVSRRLK